MQLERGGDLAIVKSSKPKGQKVFSLFSVSLLYRDFFLPFSFHSLILLVQFFNFSFQFKGLLLKALTSSYVPDDFYNIKANNFK